MLNKLILLLLFGLTFFVDAPASAAVAASVENRASGSASDLTTSVEIEARLSGEAVRENVGLGYELASDFSVAARGTTVLGKFPDYINLANEVGGKRFNIPTDIWNRMSKAEQWAANQKFLDRAIARGDDILLSNPVRNINDVTGAFRLELDYLMSNGFSLSADGARLVR